MIIAIILIVLYVIGKGKYEIDKNTAVRESAKYYSELNKKMKAENDGE